MAQSVSSAQDLGFWHPAALIATGGGLGHLPRAPGTFASLAALPVAWLLDAWAGRGAILLAGVVVALLGWWAGQIYVSRHRVQDPGEIVVDEIAAQLLVLAAVPLSLFSTVVGLLLFRLFDIAKPWPVSWADRSVKGGLGVMLDDLLAALYAAVALYGAVLLQGAMRDVS